VIKSLPDLLDDLSAARCLKKTVCFTNGCFDLLHPGHVRFLTYCKTQADILVVGLNSDASVSEVKGPKRPIVSARDRAVVLDALSMVDYVTIFRDDTPLVLIQAIRPDVLIKGSEWDGSVVGAALVEKCGGRVLLYKRQEGYSTTALIERIKGL